MPEERPSELQALQLGVEATPGTSVAANRLLTSISDFGPVNPGLGINMDRRPAGWKFPSFAIPQREIVSADFEGQASYSQLIYILLSLLGNIAIPTVGAQGEYTWVWTVDKVTRAIPKTFTIEQGSAERAHKFLYGLIPAATMRFTSEEATLSGSMVGRDLADGITMTSAGVTEPELKPIMPADVNVYVDNAGASIGTTQLLRDFIAELRIADHWGNVFALDRARNRGFSAHVERPPTVELALTVEADSVGAALLSDARGGITKFIRVEAQGPLIGGAVFYRLRLDMAGKIREPGPFDSEQDVVAQTYTFRAVWDATWAAAFKVEAINKIGTL